MENVFKDYCNYGEPNNLDLLSTFKFVKIFEDAEIISKRDKKFRIGRQDLEVIYCSIIRKPRHGNNTITPRFAYKIPEDSGKMNFNLFLNSLVEIMKKCIVNYEDEESIKEFLNSILNLPSKSHNNYRSLSIIDIISDPLIEKSRQIWHETLEIYSKSYIDHKNKVNQQNFIQFANDFSVYPDLVTRGKLLQIFENLCANDLKEATIKTSNDTYLKSLNNSQLIDGMFYACLESSAPINDPNKKLGMALGRMIQSQGPAIVSLKSGQTRRIEASRSRKLVRMIELQIYKTQPKVTFDQILGNELTNQ